ncbi:hypothetical protein SCHPADRAFT_995211 [Schizopora paradoxa]|uniref:Uncharacterized protein n=1 Tax=Schizopora paradoxa TaxID=27342 RepID=A0A0H2S3Z5_9AGAM|nr:hypothetical protein SCHPADRAFT_995211 [Schizopora paradoxa]
MVDVQEIVDSLLSKSSSSTASLAEDEDDSRELRHTSKSRALDAADDDLTRLIDATVVPEFIRAALTSRDGWIAIPFISRCFSWSFNVAWMTQVNPSTWITKNIMDASRRKTIDSIFAPLVDYLLHRNRMLFSNTRKGLTSTGYYKYRNRYEVKPEVMKIIFESEIQLEGMGKGSVGKSFAVVCLTHIITELVDKLIWAYDLKTKGIEPTVRGHDDAEVLIVDEPLPVKIYSNNPALVDDKAKKKIGQLVKWHHKIHVEWRTVVKDFILQWIQCHAETRKGQQPKTPIVYDADAKILLKKMYEATEKQRTTSQVEKVLSRIHDAALALSSFRLFDLKKWDHIFQDFSFHEAILNICEKKDTKLQNHQFMRTLFAVAVVGPICLLSGEHLSARDNTGWSITQLFQVSLLGLKNTCPERLIVEADIFNLLIDAATYGSDLIHSQLDALVPRWADLLELSLPSNSISPSRPSIQLRVERNKEKQWITRGAFQHALKYSVDSSTFAGLVGMELKRVTKRVKIEMKKARDRVDVPVAAPIVSQSSSPPPTYDFRGSVPPYSDNESAVSTASPNSAEAFLPTYTIAVDKNVSLEVGSDGASDLEERQTEAEQLEVTMDEESNGADENPRDTDSDIDFSIQSGSNGSRDAVGDAIASEEHQMELEGGDDIQAHDIGGEMDNSRGDSLHQRRADAGAMAFGAVEAGRQSSDEDSDVEAEQQERKNVSSKMLISSSDQSDPVASSPSPSIRKLFQYARPARVQGASLSTSKPTRRTVTVPAKRSQALSSEDDEEDDSSSSVEYLPPKRHKKTRKATGSVTRNARRSVDVDKVEELRTKLEAAQAENARLEGFRVREMKMIKDAQVSRRTAELRVGELQEALAAQKEKNSENAIAADALQREQERRHQELKEDLKERDIALRECKEKLALEAEALTFARAELNDAKVREGALCKELERCKSALAEAEEREHAKAKENEEARMESLSRLAAESAMLDVAQALGIVCP